MRRIFLFLVPICLLLIIGCAPKRVTRTNANETIDLSGRWNDTDSRLVSEEMIKDCLERPWVSQFTQKNKKPPTVIVGKITNKSHEHISTETFSKDLEKSLINSGLVEFVADSSQREEIREERKEQMKNASEDTQKAPGKEIGADFMVKGQINTILDEAGGEKVVFYQVELEAIDIATNKKVWIGQKKIKKLIQRDGTTW